MVMTVVVMPCMTVISMIMIVCVRLAQFETPG